MTETTKTEGLFEDVIKDAIEKTASISVLLRRCRFLAANLQNEALKVWSLQELNGYADQRQLPDYRIARINAKGFFLGPYSAQINDQPLAAGVLKEEHRWWATTAYFFQPISAYETLTGGDGSMLRVDWPADLVAHYQSKFIRGYALNRAWQEIPYPAVVGMVDTVRNRVLEFALELRENSSSLTDVGSLQAQDSITAAVVSILYGSNHATG